MADIHIEEFYKDTAIALVQLYNAFPRRVNLFVEDIAGPDQADEFGLHSRRHMACFGSLLWLAEEGYVRYVDTIRQEALDQAVLSHRAFTRLSAQASAELIDRFAPQQVADESIPPSVREDFSTHVHIIRETIRGGNSAQVSQVMQAIFFQDSH
ncbi:MULTISPECIES: hypothetical protein [Marinobacter]|uniref:Uncharacterized protein n=1 Tax=Marinobacter xestospongiae TaxID=994319 RepID=A0ABU3VXU0_9GAMM|nr:MULTISPECIES: hypothetical protein [Marinobacter]MDV2079061.1 hypothetical protein [Marinobacter xestospongiae]UDL06849.1 hypothetical protein J2887_08955 [Marinobacter sp. CA1]